MTRLHRDRSSKVTSESLHEVAVDLLDALLSRRDEARWQRLHVPAALRISRGEHPDQLWFRLQFSDELDQATYQRRQQNLRASVHASEIPVRRCHFLHQLIHRACQKKIRVGLLTLHMKSKQLVGDFLAHVTGISVERMELIETDLEDLLETVRALPKYPLRLRHLKPRDYLELFEAAADLQKAANAELLVIAGMDQLPLGGSDFPDSRELEWHLRGLSLHWDARVVLIEHGASTGS
ncbi:MAG: hypothetical protein ISQ14_14915 [Verrucomicrobiae bacterium]|nr:hypothetical protein [Verrucomicrobiae bacterium]